MSGEQQPALSAQAEEDAMRGFYKELSGRWGKTPACQTYRTDLRWHKHILEHLHDHELPPARVLPPQNLIFPDRLELWLEPPESGSSSGAEPVKLTIRLE
jgi:hypothetical protein